MNFKNWPYLLRKWSPLARLLLTFALVSIGNTLISSPIMGADITWQTMGKHQYLVTVSVYRDCNECDIPPCAGIVIGYASKCGTGNISTKKNTGIDITPVCAGQCTRCGSGSCGFDYGIMKYQFTGTVDLTSDIKTGCCEFVFSTTASLRSAAITSGAASEDLYIEAGLNACLDSSFDAPNFKTNPFTFTCLGKRGFYDLGVELSSPDPTSGKFSDSLVHFLVNPMQSSVNKTSWVSGYSFGSPYFSTFQLDSPTGNLIIRPLDTQWTITAYRAEVYRKGQLLGYVSRDISIIVTKCPTNEVVEVSGMDCSTATSAIFQASACAGEPICFKICASDKDKSDTVRLTWDGGIPDAVFRTVNPGTERDTAEFCWIPKASDAREKPYYFSVTATDNGCPVNSTQARAFAIYVKPAPKAVFTAIPDSFGKAIFIAKQAGKLPIVNYQWNFNGYEITDSANPAGNDSLTHRFHSPGAKPWSVTAVAKNGCKLNYRDTLTINPFLTVIATPDTVVCPGTSVPIKAVIKYRRSKPNILWSTGDSATEHITVKVGIRDTMVVVKVSDTAFVAYDTMFIHVNRQSIFSLKDEIHCDALPKVLFTPLFDWPSDGLGLQFHWNQLDSATQLSALDSISISDTGDYLLTITDSLGCQFTDTGSYKVVPYPIADFSVALPCTDNATTFSNKSTHFTVSNWYFGDGDSSLSKNPSHRYTKSGNYTVKLQLFNSLGCSTILNRNLTIYNTATVSVSATSKCLGDSISFHFKEVTGRVKNFQWMFDDSTFSSETRPVKVFGQPGNHPIVFSYTDSNGCNSDVVYTLLLDSLTHLTIDPKVFCLGIAAIFHPLSSTDPDSLHYFWDFGDGDTSLVNEPVHNYKSTGKYLVELKAETNKGCSTTLRDSILVEPGFPPISLAVDSACVGSPSLVDAKLKSKISKEWKSRWATGDGNLFFDSIPDYTYLDSGHYLVKMHLEINPQCTDDWTTIATVNPLPDAAFTSDIIKGLRVLFKSKATSDSCLWSLGDGSFSHKTEFEYTYQKSGSYTIFLKKTTDDGCVDSSSSALKIDPSGLDESNSTLSIYAIPNPFNSQVQIHLNFTKKEQIDLVLFDVLGRSTVLVKNQIYEPGNHLFEPDEKLFLTDGIYFLQVSSGHGSQYIKLVKSK